jgi:hypothetical protein
MIDSDCRQVSNYEPMLMDAVRVAGMDTSPMMEGKANRPGKEEVHSGLPFRGKGNGFLSG